MLSHHDATDLIHREHVQRLTDHAQKPMHSISLPLNGLHFPHALSRLAAIAHVGSALHHRRADSST
jgi:hypothetical protein